MALASLALTTFETVRVELDLDEECDRDKIERFINAVSQAISNVAGGRVFHYEVDVVEPKRGFGDFRLIMDRAPIVSIDSILLLNIDGTTSSTFASDTYEIDGNPENGIIFRPAGWIWTAGTTASIKSDPMAGSERRAIQVTYTPGYITPQQEDDGVGTRNLPYDLEQAAIDSIVALWRGSSRDRSIASKSTEQVSTSWRNPNELIGTGPHLLLPESRAVAESYYRG